ncbi:MAG: hypothetical protein N4A72_08650 [Bacteroidales bacterium]|nr:hypothetical protein [Bacteroidales bacterium]
MMYTRNVIFLLGLLLFCGCSQKNKSTDTNSINYNYTVNLNSLNNDRLTVELSYSGSLDDTTIFYLPKIIPGIYDVTNFGKYVSGFNAFNSESKRLPVTRLSENSWRIVNASSLSNISYKIDDGWESSDFDKLRPYRSSESSFANDVYILSTPAMFGYFENCKENSFQVSVIKPSALYGASSMHKTSVSDTLDMFRANSYNNLIDNPIMYSVPDTTQIRLPNVDVEVACYSTSGIKLSDKVAKHIRPLIENQTKYLGGKLPMKRYTFIIYHNLNSEPGGVYFSEGLEHAKSTVVLMYMPDNIESIKKTIYHTASHEFFHTMVPIALHSEEIHYYDYNNPEFSKHLWLYEGMTEYFTIHMPVKNGLQSIDEFINVLENKLKDMKRYKAELSLIELSKNPITYQDQYMNVYYKGPLLNLCLDIKLRELSKGKYGVQEMINDLIEEYGKDKPFKDDELFSEIIRVTGYNELDEFFNNYIVQNTPLPLVEYLKKTGLHLDLKTGKISEIDNLSTEQKILREYWINK